MLDDIGIKQIEWMLEQVSDGKPVVLLCFEDLRKPGVWCHRTMFTEWYKKRTGIEIRELEESVLEKKVKVDKKDSRKRKTPKLSLF
jgi:hypothetical protein